MGETADRYAESLDEETRSYLASRAIGPDAVAGFRLGLVVEPDPAHVQYVGRLSIPFITPTGVVHIRFRCLEDHGVDEYGEELSCRDFGHGKYESPAGETTRLFNVLGLHTATSTIGICEGELDAVVATSLGLPTVGVPGINNWKPFYYRLLDDFDRVILFGDGDSAGRKFVATLSGNIPSVIRRPMPDGHDITSYVVEYGPAAFLEFVGL